VSTDEDIWIPFRRAYQDGDPQAYLDLHAPDLIRVEADRGWIGNLDEYAGRVHAFFAEAAARGATMDIEFRFTERLVHGGLAAERGLYRFTTTEAGGSREVSYGRFHTFARHTADGWRLLVTYDYDEAGQVGEPQFSEAQFSSAGEPCR
jgi:ketosteroid isomerase-like protein